MNYSTNVVSSLNVMRSEDVKPQLSDPMTYKIHCLDVVPVIGHRFDTSCSSDIDKK